MSSRPFRTGSETLVTRHPAWLRGRRVALVSHAAAVDRYGRHTAQLIRDTPGTTLTRLMGPEHGFFGHAGAGERVRTRSHPLWKIPVHSLYGAQRRPSATMLRDVDLIVVDLCDIAVRCYTYIATLRYVMEAAAARGIPLIVADRPVPFAHCVDGPMLEAGNESFVAAIPAPMVYGMTPAETALWLRTTLRLDLDLRAAPLEGYKRGQAAFGSRPWHPPSPGIASPHAAFCYPATVWGESLPAVDVGRGSALPFQTVAAPGLDAEAFCGALDACKLRGVEFQPHAYVAAVGRWKNRLVCGARITVTNPSRFAPLQTAACLLTVLGQIMGPRRLWQSRGSRPEFFDQLHGGPAFRHTLAAGLKPQAISSMWSREARAFKRSRAQHILYKACENTP